MATAVKESLGKIPYKMDPERMKNLDDEIKELVQEKKHSENK